MSGWTIDKVNAEIDYYVNNRFKDAFIRYNGE